MDQIMKDIKMDTRLMDAGSRMSWLRNKIYRALDEEGLQNYVEQVDAKRIVNRMVEGLEPAGFRRKIMISWSGYQQTLDEKLGCVLSMVSRTIKKIYGMGT